ncbi:unnamed protein product [Vitrella brassicaformis CCMP3155]|uniref:Uncharacterized protein n=1 Tax=Vitrella brassicaformis (strain CCMP3155) TaxID=1169540 RepID=A0A0G4GK74_VITBC|nr:unnamed protein product [Vitrella brassicaformis CCMP3155]|eukprot:CEM30319.1 unnamed protein product [Vitrella brassicaformis CCMP3155]
MAFRSPLTDYPFASSTVILPGEDIDCSECELFGKKDDPTSWLIEELCLPPPLPLPLNAHTQRSSRASTRQRKGSGAQPSPRDHPWPSWHRYVTHETGSPPLWILICCSMPYCCGAVKHVSASGAGNSKEETEKKSSDGEKCRLRQNGPVGPRAGDNYMCPHPRSRPRHRERGWRECDSGLSNEDP